MGDHNGAVFGGLVDAPLKPTTKRRYQVILSRILKTCHLCLWVSICHLDLILVFNRVQTIHLFSQMYLANLSYFVPQVSLFSLYLNQTFKVCRTNFRSLFCLLSLTNLFFNTWGREWSGSACPYPLLFVVLMVRKRIKTVVLLWEILGSKHF